MSTRGATGTRAAQLLAVLGGEQATAGRREKGPAFRLATIPAGYAAGRPTLIFDGEQTATTRTYPKAKGLTLAAGDRVLVAMVGHGGVVLCVIE